MEIIPQTKTCTKCHTSKNASHYSKNSRAKDGLAFSCRECQSQYKRAYYAENSEIEKERVLAWRAKHPESARAANARYAQNHPDKIREKIRRQLRARSAATRSADADTITIEILVQRDGRACYLCGMETTTDNATIDHLVPLSRGGKHRLDNVGVCCDLCNSRKGSRTMKEYLERN